MHVKSIANFGIASDDMSHALRSCGRRINYFGEDHTLYFVIILGSFLRVLE